MTNASTTFSAVRRPEVAHPRDEAARRRSPYQAITVTRALTFSASPAKESIESSMTDAMAHSSTAGAA
jgi:hypothetical protein